MGKLKYTVGTAAASASLWLAPVAPVAADSNTEDSFNNTTTNTVTTTVDESKSITIGDCVVMMDDIKVWLDQYNKQNSSQNNVDMDLGSNGGPYLLQENGHDGGNDDGNTTNQSNSSEQSQANSQSVVITVAPDCSVTNVTEVQQASAGGSGGSVLGAQAEAAKGGVGAGVGAGASLVASFGAVASAIGAGLGIRRFGN